MGVQGWTYADEGVLAPLAAGTGAKWVRLPLSWESVQPDSGSWSSYDLGIYDTAIDAYRAQGMEVLVDITMTPAWVRHGYSGECLTNSWCSPSPDMMGAWQSFVDSIVSRYHTKVDYWEIGNEPNAFIPSDTTEDPLVAFSWFTYYAGLAIHAHGKKLVGPALAWSNDPHGVWQSYEAEAWMESFLERTIESGSVDVISVHAYREDSAGTLGQVNTILAGHYAGLMSSAPVWVTEFGWADEATTTDENQATIIRQTLRSMNVGPARWQKSFAFDIAFHPVDKLVRYAGTDSQYIRPGYWCMSQLASYSIPSNTMPCPVSGVPNGPGTHSASIAGTSTMLPGATCHWYGGSDIPDADHYMWTVDGAVVGTGSMLTYSSSTSFTLEFATWNSTAAAGTDQYVDVSDQYSTCYDQSPPPAGGASGGNNRAGGSGHGSVNPLTRIGSPPKPKPPTPRP